MTDEVRIHQRLDDVVTSLGDISTDLAVQGEQIVSIRDTVGDMKSVLDGNGKGLRVKVDRLGENEKRRTWTIRALCLGVLAGIVNFVVEQFRK